jgi:hypothetical protein
MIPEKVSEIYDLFSDLLPILSTNIKGNDSLIDKIEKYGNTLTYNGVIMINLSWKISFGLLKICS